MASLTVNSEADIERRTRIAIQHIRPWKGRNVVGLEDSPTRTPAPSWPSPTPRCLPRTVEITEDGQLSWQTRAPHHRDGGLTLPDIATSIACSLGRLQHIPSRALNRQTEEPSGTPPRTARSCPPRCCAPLAGRGLAACLPKCSGRRQHSQAARPKDQSQDQFL